jgi:glycosyltransferase 2 family protein
VPLPRLWAAICVNGPCYHSLLARLNKFNHYQKLSLLWLLAGSALFAFLVYRTGIRTIVSKLELFGAYFLLLLLISGLRQVLRTFAWRYCIEREHRQVSLLELFKLRLVGDAITDLTFAGPVLGETAKTYAAGAHMPLTFSLSSIVIENLLYGFAVVVFIISGAFVLVSRIAVPHQIRVATMVGTLALVLPILVVFWLIGRRRLVISAVLHWLERKKWLPGTIARKESRLKLFESNLYEFYGKHRAAFWGIVIVEIIANLTGVIEAYLILGVTFGVYGWPSAYLIEWTNRVVNTVFAFVPLRVGVDEGSTALILSSLGYQSAAGVSLAIIRKVRTLFWILIGLILTAQYTLSPKIAVEQAPAPQDGFK